MLTALVLLAQLVVGLSAAKAATVGGPPAISILTTVSQDASIRMLRPAPDGGQVAVFSAYGPSPYTQVSYLVRLGANSVAPYTGLLVPGNVSDLTFGPDSTIYFGAITDPTGTGQLWRWRPGASTGELLYSFPSDSANYPFQPARVSYRGTSVFVDAAGQIPFSCQSVFDEFSPDGQLIRSVPSLIDCFAADAWQATSTGLTIAGGGYVQTIDPSSLSSTRVSFPGSWDLPQDPNTGVGSDGSWAFSSYFQYPTTCADFRIAKADKSGIVLNRPLTDVVSVTPSAICAQPLVAMLADGSVAVAEPEPSDQRLHVGVVDGAGTAHQLYVSAAAVVTNRTRIAPDDAGHFVVVAGDSLPCFAGGANTTCGRVTLTVLGSTGVVSSSSIGGTSGNSITNVGIPPAVGDGSVLLALSRNTCTNCGDAPIPDLAWLSEPVRRVSWHDPASAAAPPPALSVTARPATQAIGQSVTVSASGSASGPFIGFKVTSGPEAGYTSLVSADASGTATVTLYGGLIGTDQITAWEDRDSNGVPDADEPTGTTTVQWTAPSLPPLPARGTLLALGDSIAAGEGQGPSGGYPDNPGAYPAVLAKKLGWTTVYNLAISGACTATKNLDGADPATNDHCGGSTGPNNKSILHDELPKIDSLNIQPDLITVTVGADDVYFSQCFKGLLLQPDDPSQNPCSTDTLRSSLTAMGHNLSKVLSRLRIKFPLAHIVVTDYFNPLPATVEGSAASPCSVMPLLYLGKLITLDHEYAAAVGVLINGTLNELAGEYGNSLYSEAARVVGSLDATLRSSAAAAGGQSVALDFSGHDFCTDYGSKGIAYVFGPVASGTITAKAPGSAGSVTYSRTFPPQDQCVYVKGSGCDSGGAPMPVKGSVPGTWGRLNYHIIWRINDFPHLTTSGANYVANQVLQVID